MPAVLAAAVQASLSEVLKVDTGNVLGSFIGSFFVPEVFIKKAAFAGSLFQ
jgi:hypothetical protein